MAFVFVTICIIDHSIPMFLVIEPLSFVLASSLIVIGAFSMFLPSQECTFILILIGVDDLSLVGGLIIDPLTIVDSTS